jgi:hypothetical protein
MALIPTFVLFEDEELDLDDPSLRDDTWSSDRYSVSVCGFATADTGWVECDAPKGHHGKHHLPTKSAAA